MNELHSTAKKLVANHKGLLAADESIETAGKRLAAIGLSSTEEIRRQYRNLFFSAFGIEKGISGIILHEETLNQNADDGTPFVKLLEQKGIIPGIKVDKGAKDLANYPGEKITEGLDGLRERLQEFYKKGARFAKWRAVIAIGRDIPTHFCISANAHAFAQYAALCQEQKIVPIVEPEVLIDGDHTIEKSEEVTTLVLKETFTQLLTNGVDLQGMILKSSMVIAGNKANKPSTPEEVAESTIRCFKASVPEDVPGIVFLSGGQNHVQAIENLNAVHKKDPGPWKISFSYARALQGPPLEIWKGKNENVKAAQKEFLTLLQANVAANSGTFVPKMLKGSK